MPLPESVGIEPTNSSFWSNPIGNAISGINSILSQASTFTSNVISNAYQSTQSYANQVASYPYLPSYGTPLLTQSQLNQPGFSGSQLLSPYPVQGITYTNPTQYSTPFSGNLNVTVNPSPVTVNLGGLGTLIQNSLPGIIQQVFPQISGIGTLVSALEQSVNTITNGGINNLSSQVNQIGQNVSDNVNKIIDNNNQIVHNLITNVSDTVNTLAGNFNQGLVQGINGIGQYIDSTISSINNLASQIAQNSSNLTGAVDTLINQNTAQVDAIRNQKENDFLDKMGAFGLAASRALGVATSETGKRAVEAITGIPQEILDSISKQWPLLQEAVNNIISGKYKNWDDAISDMRSKGIPVDILVFAINLSTLVLFVFKLATVKSQPVFNSLDMLSWSDNPNRILDAGLFSTLFKRKIITQEEYNSYMAKLGYSDKFAYLFDIADDKLPDIPALTQYFWRGKISETSYREMINRIGFIAGSDDIYAELTHTFLNPSDLVRIADKRIWSQVTDPKYGQYNELPKELIEGLAKWGYDQQSAKWLWAAHWELPSPQQIFDMFHRGLISQDDIQIYLGLTDWLPFFRDKLPELTYNIPSRVDIRRMYKAGVINQSQMHKYHKSMGYNEQDATFLDQFVVKTQLPEDDTEVDKLRNRVKTSVEKGYTLGLLNVQETSQMLQQLGVDSNHAQQIINLLDFEWAIENTKEHSTNVERKLITIVSSAFIKGTIPANDAQLYLQSLGMHPDDIAQTMGLLFVERNIHLKDEGESTAKELYAKHIINQNELYQRLSTLGFNASEQFNILQEANYMRDKKTKQMTEVQLTKLFKASVITLEEYRNELAGLGYQDKYINWFVGSNTTPLEVG